MDDPYHYVDIDRTNTERGNRDQSVSSRGYERLDQAALRTLGQSRRPGHYAGLVAAGSTASAAEQIEMTDVEAATETHNAVSHLLSFSYLS